MGRHTMKAGYQLDHSLKKQEQLGNPKLFQGQLNFGNDTNNPIDTGFGFANAALGVFTSYAQINAAVRGELHLRQPRVVHPGQLEGEQPAVARLRPANHEPGTELRHEAAGVELLRRPVAGVRGAAAVSARLLRCDEPVPGRESCGGESSQRRVARAEHAGRPSARSCRAAAIRTTASSSPATASRRRTTPGRRSGSRRDSARPTTCRARSAWSCAAGSACSSIG